MHDVLRRAWARARELLQRRRLRRELDEELRFHLDSETAHNLASGMTPEQAQRAARIAFGGVAHFREDTNGARGFAGAEAVVRDARLAVRRLRRAPAFAAGVVGTLAIALSAATGIGALVYGVLLKPLPYPDADRLLHIGVHTPGLGITTDEHSAGTFHYLAEAARSFDRLEAYLVNEGVVITDGEEPERVVGAIVTPGLLPLLGVTPVAGRFFLDADARENLPAIMISHALWQRRFGGDPAIAGKTIELNRRPRLILGVLSPNLEAPWDRVSIYTPELIPSGSVGLNSRYLTVVGRLASGASLAGAQQELDRLAARLPERFPELSAAQAREAGLRMSAARLHDAAVAPVRAELRLLAIMVGVLLLIAVANVATLTLLRAERLRGEVAVARALGAPSAAVVRRFVLEGWVLALGATAIALPLAMLALASRFGFTAAEVPRLHDLGLTPGVVAGVVAAALLIGTLLGVVSAARAGGGATGQALRSDGRSTRGRRWRRLQAGLVTIQVAFALALLLGAGLMGSSLVRLQQVNLGFTPTDRATFSLRVPGVAYGSWPAVTGFHARVEEALRRTPGITGAATVMQLPSTSHQLYVRPRLDVTRRDGRVVQAFVHMNIVSASYFATMEIPLRGGRTFEPTDLATAAPGVILSATLARELYGDEDPIGREVVVASGGRFPPYRVVGISDDVYADRVADGVLRIIYLPLIPDLPAGLEMPEIPAGVSFVVRSALPLEQLAPTFRAAVSSIDSRVPLWGVRTLDSVVADTTARTRLTMLLLGVAALATLLLSAVGLYSVIAYAAAARTREFAVRLALGTTPGAVMRLVLREGSVVVGVGVALGIAVSLASTRLLQSVLFEVSATDPRLYVAGTLTVLFTTTLALLVPARRAGAADPAGALRAE